MIAKQLCQRTRLRSERAYRRSGATAKRKLEQGCQPGWTRQSGDGRHVHASVAQLLQPAQKRFLFEEELREQSNFQAGLCRKLHFLPLGTPDHLESHPRMALGMA